jgi:type II secretory pathway pseudopilin PulG
MNLSAFRSERAFTLLGVLAIIGLLAMLALLLLPLLVTHGPANSRRAEVEAVQIVGAMRSYESDYGQFPFFSIGTSNAMSAAAASGEDFTYGTTGVTCVGPHGALRVPGNGFKTPSGTCAITSPGSYQANNAEAMAVLLDVESWPGPPLVPTINQGHARNPKRTPYLNAKRVGNNHSPGVGTDGVYRDPWGNPYIITLDLNKDDKCRDAFYSSPLVSQDASDSHNTPKSGLTGLIPKRLGNGALTYEANARVMVWSAGPDRMIDPTAAANSGVNRDNILSWR